MLQPVRWVVAITLALSMVNTEPVFAGGTGCASTSAPQCEGSCPNGSVCRPEGDMEAPGGKEGGGAQAPMDCACVDTGACCQANGSCADIPETECPGVFMEGDTCALTDCPSPGVGDYVASPCDNAFEDISASGIPLVLADDAGTDVALGFNFIFFGDSHANIGVASNGYLSFGNELTDLGNEPIPNPSPPNDLMAVLWDDLNPAVGGMIDIQTLGSAPNRRFIAQWTAVPRFFNSGANTFQAVLLESTNIIQFRYGAFDDAPANFTTGIENQTGSDGVAIDTSTISPGDCIQFTPGGAGPGQAVPAVSNTVLAAVALLLLFIGVLALMRRRTIAA